MTGHDWDKEYLDDPEPTERDWDTERKSARENELVTLEEHDEEC